MSSNPIGITVRMSEPKNPGQISTPGLYARMYLKCPACGRKFSTAAGPSATLKTLVHDQVHQPAEPKFHVAREVAQITMYLRGTQHCHGEHCGVMFAFPPNTADRLIDEIKKKVTVEWLLDEIRKLGVDLTPVVKAP